MRDEGLGHVRVSVSSGRGHVCVLMEKAETSGRSRSISSQDCRSGRCVDLGTSAKDGTSLLRQQLGRVVGDVWT